MAEFKQAVEVLKEIIAQPKEVSTDAGTVKQYDLDEMIEALEFLEKQAEAKTPLNKRIIMKKIIRD